MGLLHYGTRVFEFDDRTLTHLRTVIVAKLAQQESLVFTWKDSGQQNSIWLNPSALIHFEFDNESTDPLNRAWLRELTLLANSGTGLRLAPEPEV